MNNIASLDEYVVLDEENPIGYTYDLYTCIAMLFHRDNSAILAHIESNKDKYDVDLIQVLKIINLDDDNIMCVELFKGPNTNEYNLQLIQNILRNNGIMYSTKNSFVDMYKKGSIGYDYSTGYYYLVDGDYQLHKTNVLKKIL